MIPYGKQSISEQDINAVVDVLKSDYLTQGPKGKEFAQNLAEKFKSEFATVASSGTAALHLVYKALGVKEGQRVLVPAITFSATANAVEYCGGDVEFVDIDPVTFTVDIQSLEHKLKQAPQGRYSGLAVVHMAGYPADMEKIKSLADRYGLWVVEDACHAPGAKRKNSLGETYFAGGSRYSDASVFSFHPVKHIACGEGGAVLTNNKSLHDKIEKLCTHGISKDHKPSHLSDPWAYDIEELGYNYRLSDIHAALGLSQLQQLEDNIAKRQKIASQYNQVLKELPLKLPKVEEEVSHAYHLYIVRTKERKELYEFLRERQIFTQVHYVPVSSLSYYRKKYGNLDLPNSKKYYSECLSLPIFPTLKNGELKFIIKSIYEFFEEKYENK